MEYRICLLFIMTHFFCDFIIQSNRILQLRFCRGVKKVFFKSSIKGNLYHSISHLVFMVLVLGLAYLKDEFEFTKFIIVAIVIAIVHLLIDEGKSIMIYFKHDLKDNIYVFLSDQVIHILSIIVFVSGVKLSKFYSLINFIREDYPKNLEFIDKIIICVIVFIICTHGIGIFIKKFMIHGEIKDYSNITKKEIILKKPQDENLGAKNGGFVIGILERIFILLVVAIGQPAMAGFVLTAKSIARFKKLDDNSFAEYFIIGTFISFIGAIIGGILIKSLNLFPIIK